VTTHYGCKLPDYLTYQDLGDQKDECMIVVDQDDPFCIVHKDEFPLVDRKYPPKAPFHAVLQNVLKECATSCRVVFLPLKKSDRKIQTLKEYFDV
jgi:hypothetical protein